MERRYRLAALAILAAAGTGCAGDDNSNPAPAPDAAVDATTTVDASNGDADNDNYDATADGGDASSTADSGGDASATDSGSDAAACPAAWLVAPSVPAFITPDAGAVVLHAAASGTQNYACKEATSDAGVTTYTWTLTGPTADLHDCHGTIIGAHFASDGGAAFPEWKTSDGTYVIASKANGGYVPDGGTGVAWLLLNATAHGGTGTLSTVSSIQRLDTDGGVANAAACGDASVDMTTSVPYTADYYFYAP